jgi:hypothetical protein
VAAAPDRLSGSFGTYGLGLARPTKESPKLSGIYICACTLVLACGSGDDLFTARAGSLPAIESIMAIPGWAIDVALYAEAAHIYALRSSAADMGHP